MLLRTAPPLNIGQRGNTRFSATQHILNRTDDTPFGITLISNLQSGKAAELLEQLKKRLKKGREKREGGLLKNWY